MIAKIKLYLNRSIKISIRTLFMYMIGYLIGMFIWIIGLIPVLFLGLVYLIIYYFFRFELSMDPLDFYTTNELFQDILFNGTGVFIAMVLGLYPAIKNPDIEVFH
tara:strand:- start:596 stop:910 length:315 start_codon:yes stop_codon:yes gene_type:complete